jgi:hypothetical protein
MLTHDPQRLRLCASLAMQVNDEEPSTFGQKVAFKTTCYKRPAETKDEEGEPVSRRQPIPSEEEEVRQMDCNQVDG